MGDSQSQPPPQGVSRRTAIGNGLAVAAGSVLMSGTPAIASNVLCGRSGYERMPGDWSTLIGDSFSVAPTPAQNAAAGTQHLVLLDVQTIQSGDAKRPSRLRPRAFSLLFRGTAMQELPAGCYRVSHSSIGEIQLLINRIRCDGYPAGELYEAVFN